MGKGLWERYKYGELAFELVLGQEVYLFGLFGLGG